MKDTNKLIDDICVQMALLSSLKQIASIDSSPFAEALKADIFQLVLGTLSLPINLPGTKYRRAFQVRCLVSFAQVFAVRV